MLNWIILAVAYVLFLVVILLIVFFLRNVKNEKAKIVSDKFSIIFIAFIALFFLVYQIYFTIIGIKTNFAQITLPISGLPLSLFLYLSATQNVFAYSQNLVLIGFEKYNRAQLHVKSIKKGFDNRVSIKIINTQVNCSENKIVISLSDGNYQKYGTLFSGNKS